MKAKIGTEAPKKNFEASRIWFMKLRKEAISVTCNYMVKQQMLMYNLLTSYTEDPAENNKAFPAGAWKQTVSGGSCPRRMAGATEYLCASALN